MAAIIMQHHRATSQPSLRRFITPSERYMRHMSLQPSTGIVRGAYLVSQMHCDQRRGTGRVGGHAGPGQAECEAEPAHHEAEPAPDHGLRQHLPVRGHLHVHVLLVHAAHIRACSDAELSSPSMDLSLLLAMACGSACPCAATCTLLSPKTGSLHTRLHTAGARVRKYGRSQG